MNPRVDDNTPFQGVGFDHNDVATPTITLVIHRPIIPDGGNGWGSALYQAYLKYVDDGKAQKVRVVHAPPGYNGSGIGRNQVVYEPVKCKKEIFTEAKKGAIDVYLWDSIHLLHNRADQPIVCQDIQNGNSLYPESFKNYFLYSIHAAHDALELAYDDDDPIFHLQDVHDAFVSALFKSKYDRAWLVETIGHENVDILDRFEETRDRFQTKHSSINHMRFWHTPAMVDEVWKAWYDLDPELASHVAAGIFSSPLVVHSPMWRDEFETLKRDAIPRLDAQISSIRSVGETGIGIGPIGYEVSSFKKRFTEYDPTGQYQRVPDLLEKWGSQIRGAVPDDKQPIVVFLTCRGDDGKNNLPETIQALMDTANSNEEIKDRLAVVCVYSKSREDEHEIYRKTVRDLNEKLQLLRDGIGSDRVISAVTKNGDLTEQTAGFMLADAFVCGARGGFDVVALEASYVAAWRQNGEFADEYRDLLSTLEMGEQFHLVLAKTAGSARYLENIFENVEIADGGTARMPDSSQMLEPLKKAFDSLLVGKSSVNEPGQLIASLERVCSGPDCIEQWVDASRGNNPADCPRTAICEEIGSPRTIQCAPLNASALLPDGVSSGNSQSLDKSKVATQPIGDR